MLTHEPAKITVLICVLAASVALAALAGCSSVGMKGTPFYTGEYEEHEGPVEDRVNVWPLVYYSDPALSILWPFIELTDDHFAIRPVYSVYGLDKEKQIHNVLWPIAEFDGQEQANRIFPFFWWGEDNAGDDYATVFPLYWHRGDPYGGDGGLDTLFPIWLVDRDGRNFDLYFLWPFINAMRQGDQEGWHVWPLAGSRKSDDGYRRYAFWPLMHQWLSKEDEEHGQAVLPFYYRRIHRDTSGFYSLPWSMKHKANGDFWQLAPPLFYRTKNRDDSRFYSLPWSAGKEPDGDFWQFAPPLFYRAKDGDGSRFYSLPWSAGEEPDGDLWQFAPPLFYRAKDGDSSRFYSLPWSARTKSDDEYWRFIPPLFYWGEDRGRSAAIALLWGQGASEREKSSWHALAPFYFYEKSEDERLLATPLGIHKASGEERDWMFFPLLASGKRRKDSGSASYLGGLIHGEWSGADRKRRFFPLYAHEKTG